MRRPRDPFHELVYRRLRAIGKEQRWLAHELGMDPSRLSQIFRTDHGALIKEDQTEWADLLRLKGPEREQFIAEMVIAGSGENSALARFITGLLEELARLRAEEDRLRRIAELIRPYMRM